jgi:hypothetical protein
MLNTTNNIFDENTMDNFTEFANKIKNLNIENINIQKYIKDYSINMELFNLYERNQTCATKYLNFIKKIYESATYITGENAISQYNKNADSIKKYICDDYLPIIITTIDNINKSNFFYTLYLLKLLNERYIYPLFVPNIRKIMDKDGNILLDFLKNKKLLIIFSDDFSYSGIQLANHINPSEPLTNDGLSQFGIPGYSSDYQSNQYNDLGVATSSISFL